MIILNLKLETNITSFMSLFKLGVLVVVPVVPSVVPSIVPSAVLVVPSEFRF